MFSACYKPPMKIADHAATSALRLVHEISLGPDSAAPLVIFVHGRAGKLGVMAPFYRLPPDDWHRIAVQAPLADPLGGFSWWEMQEPTESDRRAAQIENARSLLAGFLIEAIRWYQIRPSWICLLGFSQGGAVASLLLHDPQLPLHAAGLLASFALTPGEHQPRGAAAGRSVFIAHGTEDQAVPIEKARQGAIMLRESGAALTFIEDPVGHKVGSAGMRALKRWLEMQGEG